MNPNVYTTYLCLINNNSEIRLRFMIWRSKAGRDLLLNRSNFETSLNMLRWQKEYEAKRVFIFEAEHAWANFNYVNFTEFLKRYGFDENSRWFC